jgi:xylan 1,4-beta-xylosidase
VPVAGGRGDVDLVRGRNEVSRLELPSVVDETPEWWSDNRLFGLGTGKCDASGNRS